MRKRTLLLACALAAGGCGGDSDADAPRGRDLTAVECPMERTVQPNGEERYAPAENAFDTAELLGEKVKPARAKAAEHGCEIVVASEDGRGRPVPIELDPTRIYVFVERGVVTYIEGVGGGI